VAHALWADGFDASEDGTGRGTPLVPVAVHGTQDPDVLDNLAHSLGRNSGQENAVAVDLAQVTSKANRSTPQPVSPTLHRDGTAYAFDASGYGAHVSRDTAPTLQASAARLSNQVQGVFTPMAVRRLTPRECARLQGFPDDYLDITYRGKPAKDGPRYKALGNSMAVNVMRWLGTRIQLVDDALRASPGERVA
jgi:DNA (cytosine-5)-methyltransferase 1